MIELPSLLPTGSSYVRIPRSKSAAMRVILETVQRGSRYWTGGVIPIAKAMPLADKFAHRYGTSSTQSKRAWDKAHGRSNATLIMYPEDDRALTPMRWWLLVTPGTGIVHQEEQLRDTWEKRQRLTWGEQYELIHLQRERKYGGGRSWTWRVTEQRHAELEAAMISLASAHGGRRTTVHETGVLSAKGSDRVDDLLAFIASLKRMPGFHGIRMQQMKLYALGRACWQRTHGGVLLVPVRGTPDDEEPALVSVWPSRVPYVDKRQLVYHRPNPLKLDVLVRLSERRQQATVKESDDSSAAR